MKTPFLFFINTTKSLYTIDAFKNFSLKKELISDIDSLLEARDYPNLDLFIKNGYVLTAPQAIKAMVSMSSLKEPHLKPMLIELYHSKIEEGFYKNIEKIYEYCEILSSNRNKYFNNKFKKHDQYTKLQKGLQDKIIPIWNNSSSVCTFFIYSNISLEDNEKNQKLLTQLRKIEEEMNFYTSDYGYSGFSTFSDMKTKMNQAIKVIKTKIPNIEKSHIASKLAKYSPLLKDMQILKNNMVIDVVNTIKNFDEKSLPSIAQNYIKEIRGIYADIKVDSINIQQKLELENLYNKRFPQVLEEYILISPRYKEKLKGQASDPDSLLIESLAEIRSKVNEVFEQIQNNNHNKLKVSRNYLGNI